MERNPLRKRPGTHHAQARPGRPSHVPTKLSRHQVELMATLHNTHEEIAAVLKINTDTLEKYYTFELRHGMANKNQAVLGNLYRLATGSSKMAAASAIFWLKTRAQMRETMGIAGEDGHGPILTADAGLYSTNEGRATRLAQLINWITTPSSGQGTAGDGSGLAT